uniref:Centriole, cilia and spindle associated protein n=1 Tax=Latimeria chalumnae TaxID=7897 RepID=H3ABT7_LATCH
MVAKRIKTEYMKKFKDPKWEAYGRCYEEMVRYRETRRLLEHAHSPWMWEEWEGSSDSSSSGGAAAGVAPQTAPAGNGLEEEEGGGGTAVPVALEPEQAGSPAAGKSVTDKNVNNCFRELEVKDEKPAKPRELKPASKSSKSSRPEKAPRASRSSRPIKKSSKTADPEGPSLAGSSISSHPFAMYGWAEKQSTTGCKKTHNVRASTSTKEV